MGLDSLMVNDCQGNKQHFLEAIQSAIDIHPGRRVRKYISLLASEAGYIHHTLESWRENSNVQFG